MTTVIVPLDFSDTSLHAAHYATQLLVGQYGVTLLLYHCYQEEEQGKEAEKTLEALKERLMLEHIVKIETLCHQDEDFVEGLERAIRHRKADLVIMGMSGKSGIAQVFFGSNTLKVVATKACPVLIIPESAKFSPIKNVMLTSDFKDTFNTTPSAPIRDFLLRFLPKLHVVNVNHDHYVSLTSEYEEEKQNLRQMFREFNPEFYFMRLFDVDQAINMFAEDKDIDLIIAIQRNKSFMDKLFRRSRTESLAYQSKVPILAMHE
jgi:nucleotide-binding universal stress UspA family protein